MSDDQFLVEWQDSGREPQCEPNPAYPNGIDLDVAGPLEPYCTAAVPYPAKRRDFYVVRCKLCDFSVAITTAGRVDDPKSIRVPCVIRAGETKH